ncbi:hypothetical protein H6F32_12805 [Anabaena sp. FACHB-1237]|uniref:hypothetical protein n=1 Tax=Anabaena sp. FACHB-1237 TaxID=2692769 RepID=UPI00168172DD|nr:hypothetical protein [Anabaena sp. FACHB-1237]MBD2138448.1 hypothetical protein [Anabaena sp. FACHB-1237]
MLEKLIQAAFITFLLQLIAVLNVNPPIRYKTVLNISQSPETLLNFSVLDQQQ